MTIDQARLRSLIEAATKGPWCWGADDIDAIWAPDTVGDGNVVCLPPPVETALSLAYWPANAALIVAAVNALPALLDRVAELEEAMARIEQEANTPRKFWSGRIAEIARQALPTPRETENG